MIRHQWFDLWLHTDDELSAHLGSPVIERETLHEWPLSCVQRLVTADGQRWIYKTQHAPTVEDTFYAAANSDLLISARILERDPLIMLLYFIDASTLPDVSEAEAVQLVNRVLAGIRQIKGNPPVWLDISSANKWRAVMLETRDTLKSLVESGGFTQVDENAIQVFERCFSARDILDAADCDPGLVHGDLYRENLFLLPDGSLKVIDWARPYRGPAELDRVTLLDALGFAPPSDTPIAAMSTCLRIHWLAACASRWFPPGIETYDEQIAGLIEKLK